MESEYISIKDFADLAGVSVQSLYKRIKKPLNSIQPYLKEVDGKIMIRVSAIDDLYKNTKENTKEEKKEPMERILDILENQIKEKDRQIEEKDKQIENLLKRIEDTEKLLDQQQQLKALETKLLIDNKESDNNNIEEKKSFFSRFFK